MCSDTLKEQVEENNMNTSRSTKCCLGKKINIFQAKIDKRFDLHEHLSIDLDLESISYGLFKGTSPSYIENDQVIRDK